MSEVLRNQLSGVHSLDGCIIRTKTLFSFKKHTVQKKQQICGKWNGEEGCCSIMEPHSKGVMILLNPKLDYKIEKISQDKNGRFIIAK